MNLETVHYINMLMGLGVIILQALCVLAILLLLFRVKESKYLSFIKKNFLEIGFFLSLLAFLTSLFYTEILHWVPCFYCWYDRIWIFPQTVIFGVAWFRKPARPDDLGRSGGEKNVFWYSLLLSLFGLVNSLKHIYIYYYGEGLAPCDASGVSCVQRLVSEFGGYISIPTNAFTGFLALMTLLAVVYFYKKEN